MWLKILLVTSTYFNYTNNQSTDIKSPTLFDWTSTKAESPQSKLTKHANSVQNRQSTRSQVFPNSEECTRECKEGERKICHYHFTLEFYNVLGGACKLCTPNSINTASSDCQCILADGVERGVLTANRRVPGPGIQVCKGDKVVVDVANHMEGLGVTIHWHGILQRGTQYHDGVPFVTQCPIHQSNTFRYQWIAEGAGTHFWHAHSGVQKVDGLYGSLVVRQPPSKDPNSNTYDYDLPNHVMLISDWFHVSASERFPGRLSGKLGQKPDNLLINGKGLFQGAAMRTPLEVFELTPGKRFRFRLINAFSSSCGAQLTVEGHQLTLIESDGSPVEPVRMNTINSYSGERFDFVVNANREVGSYWIQLRALGTCTKYKVQQLGILRYDGALSEPSTEAPTYDAHLSLGVILNPVDLDCNKIHTDAVCINQLRNANPVDPGILQEPPDVKIHLPYHFHTYELEDLFKPNTYNNFITTQVGSHVTTLIDGISYVPTHVPLISQYDQIDPGLFCNSDNKPGTCGERCFCTHKIEVPLNAIVEIIMVDEQGIPDMAHSFHLHGHTFYVLGIGISPYHNVKNVTLEDVLNWDKRSLIYRNYHSPPGKDTVTTPRNGYSIIRFRANNPGFWMLHCHFLYHIPTGMNVVLQVGTLKDLPPVPPNFPRCGNYLPNIEQDFDEN